MAYFLWNHSADHGRSIWIDRREFSVILVSGRYYRVFSLAIRRFAVTAVPMIYPFLEVTSVV